MKIIRDSDNNIAYKLYENKLYSTTTVRNSKGETVATYSNKDKHLKTTTEKLKNR